MDTLRARRTVAGRQLARLRAHIGEQLLQILRREIGLRISMNEVVDSRTTGSKSFTGRRAIS